MPTTNASFDAFGDRGPLLRWLVFTGLCVFAAVLLWRYGLIGLMVAGDRTYLSSIIALLYVAASLHCLWRTIVISRESREKTLARRLSVTAFARFTLDHLLWPAMGGGSCKV